MSTHEECKAATAPAGGGQPACHDCLYFHEHAHDRGAGDCRRYPPCFAGEDSPNEKHRWKFPLVLAGNWCGEFKEIDCTGSPRTSRP